MKKLFFDIETTGVKHWENGIHQLSGIICIDGEVKEQFNFKVKPFEFCVIEPEALALNNLTTEDLEKYPEPYIVYCEFVAMLSKYVDKYNRRDKFHLCGYNNASFDNQFLRAWFSANGDKYFGSWFWSDTIDVMVLASYHLQNERDKMPNFKLHTVAEQLQLEVEAESLHDALYDIQLTKKIFDKIINSKN